LKPFIVVRVPIILTEEKAPARRPTYGLAPNVVGEFDTAKESADEVARRSYGDRLYHYYGLELRFTGGPDRKTAAVVSAKPAKGSRPKLAVNNNRKEKRA